LAELVTFPDKMIKDKRKEAKKLLRAQNIYDIVRGSDIDDPDMLNEQQYKILRALEDGFTAYCTVFDQVSDLLKIGFHEKDDAYNHDKLTLEKNFRNIYSLFIGASIISNKISSMLQDGDSTIGEVDKNYEFDFFKNTKDETAEYILQKYITAVVAPDPDQPEQKFVKNSEDLLYLSREIFDSIAESCVKLKDEYSDLVKRVEDLSISMFDTTINGFKISKSKEEIELEDTSYEDIVGNVELIKFFKIAEEYLLSYNPEKRKNFIKERGDFPSRAFITGKPGGGKTTGIRAFINSMKKRAEEQGLELNLQIIGSADIKDKWFGESPKKVREKLRNDPNKLNVYVIEDLDAVLAARDDPQLSPADRDIISEFLNTLEGLASKDYGNSVLITTSNLTPSESNPTPVDPAVLGRIAQTSITADGPETEAEYAKLLFDIKLKKAKKGGYLKVSDKDYLRLGKVCKEYGFSGRDVNNLAKQISAEAIAPLIKDAKGKEKLAEIRKLKDFDKQLEEVVKYFGKIDTKILEERINDYNADTKKLLDAIEESKRANRVRAIIAEVKAQNEVQQIYLKKGMNVAADPEGFETLYNQMYAKLAQDFGKLVDDALSRTALASKAKPEKIREKK